MQWLLLGTHWRVKVFIHWMENETVWITPFVSNCQLSQLYRTALHPECVLNRLLPRYFRLLYLQQCKFWKLIFCDWQSVNVHVLPPTGCRYSFWCCSKHSVADRVWLAFGGEIISAHALWSLDLSEISLFSWANAPFSKTSKGRLV